MTRLRRILIGAALCVAASGLASASSIDVFCSTASGSTELGLPPETAGQVTCGAEPALPSGAVLTGVSIDISGGVIAPSSITLTNNDQIAHTFSASTDSAFNVDPSTTLPGVTFTLDGFGNLFDAIANTGNQNLAACTSGTSPCTAPPGATVTVPVAGSSSTGFTGINSLDWAFYEAGFSFYVDTDTGLTTHFNGGNGTATQATFANATAEIEYDYTIPTGTPEPGTMALMGGALLGVGLIGKRIKKS